MSQGLILAGLLAIAGSPSPGPSPSDPLHDRIGAAAAQVSGGEPLNPEEVEELRALAAAEGTAIASDLECVLADGGPDAVAPGLQRLARRVAAVRSAQSLPGSVETRGRAALARVLQRREFAAAARSAERRRGLGELSGWLERVFRSLSDWLERQRGTHAARAPGFSFGIGAGPLAYAVLLLVLALVGLAAWRWVGERYERRPETAAKGAARSSAGAGEEALSRAPEDWWALAEERLAAGDAASACRALYLALLVALHRAGATEVHSSRTNWEHSRRIARRLPAVAGEFRELTGTFDRVVYGGEAVGRADYLAARSLAEQVLGGIAALAPAAGPAAKGLAR